ALAAAAPAVAQEHAVRGTLPAARLRLALHVGAVGLQVPGLAVVGEADLEHRLQALLEERVQHRRDDLDAAVEVARHPVGGAEVVLRRAAVAEHPDARVLEEAPDDAHHADALGEAGDARAQATDAAHDEIDLDAGLPGLVERLDDLPVDQGVHLGDDAPVAA